MVDKVNLLDVSTITQDCILMLPPSHYLKIYQEKFKLSDAQAAQRAAHLPLCTMDLCVSVHMMGLLTLQICIRLPT